MSEIVVLVAHPELEQSRVNRRLMEAAARAAPGRVDVRDLYALYPDYWIDVAAEQAALGAARLVVWQHPLHWYGMTPLMKLWLDEVLAFGWAYGPGGRALAGKDLWLVLSTGGTEASYAAGGPHGPGLEAFLPPYERTAALVGMRFLPPLVLHGAHRVGEAGLEAHAARLAQRLVTYPDWPELVEPGGPGMAQEVAAVGLDDRPASGVAPMPGTR